jgi:hypothetical protein
MRDYRSASKKPIVKLLVLNKIKPDYDLEA